MSSKGQILKGIGVSEGIAIGPAYVVKRGKIEIIERTIQRVEVDTEREKFRRSLRKTREELEKTRERIAKLTGENEAGIIDGQLLLLSDKTLIDPIIEEIETKLRNSEFLFNQKMEKIISTFTEQSRGNEYFTQRIQDLKDLQNQLLSNLLGVRSYIIGNPNQASILVIPHLAPAESVQLLNKNITGIVTERGGVTSHIAIISRTMEFPAVLGIQNVTEVIGDRTSLILDGEQGIVIVNPDGEEIKEYQKKRENFLSRKNKFLTSVAQPPVTIDEHRVTVSANIELPEETELVRKNGGEGVGLFRTEIIFISQTEFPTEERQFELYSRVVKSIAPQPVIIRTFDIGGDKFNYSSSASFDPNPFLGWRAIRIGLQYPNILKTQLRAILRASVFGNVKIMFPMISNIEELDQALLIYNECKAEMKNKGIEFNNAVQIGIMIEVPSAALSARYFAEKVKFFSIGTNDLVQYTLAVDRGNQKVAHLYQSYHPAVIRLIKETISAGRKANIWTGICGEMAGDPKATLLLLGLGIDEFSCVPTRIPLIKSIIRSVNYRDALSVAEEVIQCKSQSDVLRVLNKRNKEILPPFILNNTLIPIL